MLKNEEIVALAPDAIALGKALLGAFGPESDGGKTPTSAELKAIGKLAIQLGVKIVLDVVD